ncbi:MAG TPA: hypothetical protein DEP35_17910 [Deltaproteobacteria bacterium]|jgi:hypothetical protein|nr:hypothetical protein [Deltaproteobacteria bacterium]
MAASNAKGGLLLLLLLVGGVGGVGYWNYQRHVEAENSEPRPFRGYATADLDKMIAAQKPEIARMRTVVENARLGRTEARSNGFIAEQVHEFERVHRESSRERELSERLADLEIMQQQLEKERAKRTGEGEGALQRVLRLAFTF